MEAGHTGHWLGWGSLGHAGGQTWGGRHRAGPWGLTWALMEGVPLAKEGTVEGGSWGDRCSASGVAVKEAVGLDSGGEVGARACFG